MTENDDSASTSQEKAQPALKAGPDRVRGILVLSGQIRSGKTTLARRLEARYHASVFKTNEALKKRLSSVPGADRKRFQEEGAQLDVTTKGAWVEQELTRWLAETPRGPYIVVDAARIEGQVKALRDEYGSRIVHFHLTAQPEVLRARFAGVSHKQMDKGLTYDLAINDSTEKQVETLAKVADVVIATDPKTTTPEDMVARAIAHLRAGRPRGSVDVLVGGQYGSEGKGQVASFIAGEYDLLVRVGGPNAGHKVFSEPRTITHHLLPSGTTKSEAKLLLGPGAVISVDTLLAEIEECGNFDRRRLKIDKQAMIISPEDVLKEAELVRTMGSTGQGVGVATARRILERVPPGARLARDVPELRDFLCDSGDVLADALAAGDRILLEGTQGTGLSLYHGNYPWVTSRDTTVAGCLAEAGIPPAVVRKVIMVCRTYPIRVDNAPDGTSGPMFREIKLEDIAQRSGKDVEELRKTERTSTTNRRRRIGEFDWPLFQRSVHLNAPTDIALTFTDYLDAKNGEARRVDQLTPETIAFIQELERVAGVPVSLITTGFNAHSVIDRRSSW